jgi:hypothetical protein
MGAFIWKRIGKLKAFFLERSWNELNLGPVGFSPGKKGGKHGSETQFHSG